MTNTIITVVITFIVSSLCSYSLANIKNVKVYKESIKCLLRANMVNTYFAYKEIGKLPIYVKQNWYYLYEQYKSLGGNSFIDDIKGEIDKMEIGE